MNNGVPGAGLPPEDCARQPTLGSKTSRGGSGYGIETTVAHGRTGGGFRGSLAGRDRRHLRPSAVPKAA